MTRLAYPRAFRQHSRIAAPLYSCRILFKQKTRYISRMPGSNIWWSWWKAFQINIISKYFYQFGIKLEDVLILWKLLVRSSLLFSMQNFKIDMDFVCQWHPTKMFPFEMKRALWVVNGHNWRPFMWEPCWYLSLSTCTTSFVVLYLCTFSLFPSVPLAFMAIRDVRTRECFSKDEVYWSSNMLSTGGESNK